jgi:hypothetical protein
MQKRFAARLRAMMFVVLGLVSCVAAAQADTINWGNAPQTNLLTGNDSNRPATPPVGVTVTTTGAVGGTGTVTLNALDVVNGTPMGSNAAGVIRMQMDASAGTSTGNQTVTMTFSQPVYDVSFRVTDIDGGTGYNGFNDWVFLNSNVGFPTRVVPVNAANVSYNPANGRATAISNTDIANTSTAGDITVTFAGPVTSITVRHENGPDSDNNSTNQWVFINDITFFRTPTQLRVAKSTGVGTGTFTFNTSNSGTGVTATNVTAGTVAANSPFVRLNIFNTATTVTETGPAGWFINNGNVTCADSNSANSGNPATFNGTITTNATLTVPAANIRGGASITCNVVNQRLPTVQIVKISQGAVGPFSFTGDNGFGSDAITTTATSTATVGAVKPLTAVGTVTNISEAAVAGWEVNGTPTCTVNGTAQTITWAPATRTIQLTTAQTALGNAIVCTITNRRLPRVTVRKTTLGGAGGPFTFTQTGLAAINNINTTTANTATPSTTGTITGTIGGATTITEGAMPSAIWRFADAACADSNSALSGNPANVGTVAGQTVTLTTAMVAGADIVCTFRNGVIPTVAVRKTTLGNSAGSPSFAFTQTNLSANPASLNTTAHNTPTAYGATVTVTNNANPVTITEAVATGYYFGSASCTDANSATSGNPAGAGSFGTTTGNQLNIPAANLPYGAQVQCTFTNNVVPTIRVRKITVGGVGGPFTFTQTNLATNPSNVTTTSAGVTTAGTPPTVDVVAIGTAITVTEAAFTGYNLTGATCDDGNAAITGNTGTFGTLSGAQLTIPASAVVAGARFFCTFTNQRLPRVTVQTTTLGGVGGPFTFTQTGLAAINDITTATANTPTASTSGVITGTIGGTTTITEGAMPSAIWRFVDASCTDTNSAVSLNPTNVGTVAGQTVTLTTWMVAGADIVCTFRNGVIPTVAVRKTTFGNAAASPNFSFTQTNLSANPAARSTTGNNTPSAYSPTVTVTNTANPVTITEAAATGYAFASATCTDANNAASGNPAGAGTFGTVVGTQISILATNLPYGAQVQCTFVNNLMPTMTVRKTTVGGVGGPFTFTQTNLAANPSNITTTIAGTPATGTPASVNVTAIGTAITVTEAAFTGYTLTGATCTDSNATITGNTGTFGSLTGSTLTVANTAVVVGAQLVCTFSNDKLPTLTIRKVSVGNVGDFTFTGNNGFPSTTITTTASGTLVTGPQHVLAAKLTATNITETPVPGYVMSLMSCSGLTGSTPVSLSGTTIQIPSTAIDAGANVICDVMNRKRPTVLVRKTTLGGVGGPYTFASTNITGTINGITTTVAGTPVATSSGALPITTQASPVTITEAPASGYFLSGASCTDNNTTYSGNPTGTFGVVAGNALTVPNTRTVWGAELVCTFTNTLANPQLQLTKSASPPGPKNRNDVVTYTFTVVNTGNVPITNVQAIETAFNGYGTAPVPGNEVIVTDVAPLGDSTDGGVNGTWTTLGPGDTIRFTATYTVDQGDIDFNQ